MARKLNTAKTINETVTDYDLTVGRINFRSKSAHIKFAQLNSNGDQIGEEQNLDIDSETFEAVMTAASTTAGVDVYEVLKNAIYDKIEEMAQ